MNRTVLSRRRSLGSYYTPEWIARAMVARCLVASESGLPARSWRMLDPACGDGAFVLAVLEHLGQVTADRLSLVRDCVFGVDADPAAIGALRERVAAWILCDSANDEELKGVLATNFLCGDALLGPKWAESETESSKASAQDFRVIDWPRAFPHIAAHGGFDLVIGNPPYRRELNSKVDFDRIAPSPLGLRWRRARMDLWHYFLHRGLDLLKPGGTLCYIVNSYWTGSTAARPLVERLASETTMDEVILFGASKLFRDVTGRHMIFRARKGLNAEAACQIIDLSDVAPAGLEAELTRSSPARAISQHELWRGGRMRIEAIDPRGSLPDGGPSLGEVFEVRQGIAENPPFVTKAIAKELGNPSLTGRGVFVLTRAEVESLGLSARERSLLRPYYALSTVERFQLAPEPTHWLLYLTKQTASTLDELPRIASHLARYRAALERRREAASGAMAWWHLHWPREERLFTLPRILCPQMGHMPRFVFADCPTFVGFSQHVIVERTSCPEYKSDTPSLAALSALLNSSPARAWFEAHAKRRGANLDISGSVLKQFPLPSRPCPELHVQLDRLAREWPAVSSDRLGDVEVQLDRLVHEWYANMGNLGCGTVSAIDPAR
jgi:adenine-specific DNA-methyltransferase